MSEVSCPRCNIANPSNHFFCTECGANLRITDVEGRERQSLARELESVRWQLNGASRELDRLQVRISRLEGGPAIPTQPQPPVQDDQAPARPQPPASQPEAQPADIPRDRSPVSEGPAYRRPHGPPSPSSASVTRAANAGEALGGSSSGAAAGVPNSTGGISFGSSIDWEHVLGRNWFAIIGAVSLVLGLGFFLKLSFDNNWIGDTGRIVLGIAAGMALLGTGEYAQRRVPLWAQAVTAGGAAILYLSIYSAFALYQLIRPDVALLFLAVVVGLAGLLAIRYDSIVIGFLGIIGAFIAPVLLGPELLDIRLALPYILIVDLGILWVATFRNWRWFVLMGWIGSYGLFAAALDQFPGYEPILMQAGLTAMFLIFVGATTLFHILWRRVPGPLDMSIVAINGTAFFALTVAILWEDYQVWFGLISLSLSLLYGLIAYAALKRPRRTDGDSHDRPANGACLPDCRRTDAAQRRVADHSLGGAGRSAGLDWLPPLQDVDADIRSWSPGAGRRVPAVVRRLRRSEQFRAGHERTIPHICGCNHCVLRRRIPVLAQSRP